MAVVVGFILISLYLPLFSLQMGWRGINPMATTTNNPVVPGGTDDAAEREQARRLAERYRCPFVDLLEQRIDPELFRSIPAELMFRYNFVPLEGARDHPDGRDGRPQPAAAHRRTVAPAWQTPAN
jgi:hypothetical protein